MKTKAFSILTATIILTACGGDTGAGPAPTPPPVSIGAIKIKSVSTNIVYDETLSASSTTSVEINGGPADTNAAEFDNPPDNTSINIRADLEDYTIGNEFTVKFTANIEDASANQDTTSITAIINP